MIHHHCHIIVTVTLALEQSYDETVDAQGVDSSGLELMESVVTRTNDAFITILVHYLIHRH